MQADDNRPYPIAMSPRTVPVNGNEIFVYLSMGIYNRHDEHAQIRKALARKMLLTAYGTDSVASVTRDSKTLDSLPGQAWFKELSSCVNLRENHLSDILKLQFVNGYSPYPPVAFQLASECYLLCVVLYEETALKQGAEGHPSRVWGDPSTPSTNKITFLRRKNGLIDLLVPPGGTDSYVTTKFVSVIDPDKILRQETSNPSSGYTLACYDKKSRRHEQIRSFYGPSLESGVTRCHYLWIKSTPMSASWSFVVYGCNEIKKPIFVYAIRTKPSVVAFYMANWKPNYVDPAISIEPADECIVIVEANDSEEASKFLVTDFKCAIKDSRSGGGTRG